ncbi:FkbM family methyltransferase [Spongiactinospora sp. TRM90649]|uniref:FkbM family methyltransferase n=1 Tax=Spongiactinospora sp. TRM90649 TaxID=3031114 RepID=UPI0023F6FE37|nr:FkbM family methyltransferase [Spongiactinospora sp. TRM90649]MDF5751063.1 FkbM family methyltransferase [Spongiactinospora sp. TRM90649]
MQGRSRIALRRAAVIVRGAVAGAIPPRWFAALLRAAYPRLDAELARAETFVPRGGTAVDVGVWYAPWTARLRALGCDVVAVEANPRLARLARRSFPGVRVVEAAASDRAGTAELWIPGGGRGAEATASLVHAEGTRVVVPAVRLDDLGLTGVRFMKIDVEGHEAAVLRGARETVARDRPMLLVELETRHQDVSVAIDLVTGWGYAPYVLTEGRWTPLAGFDLAAHQAARAGEVARGFIARVLRPGPEYVNMVLFVPDETPFPVGE